MVLSLGEMPLANSLLTADQLTEPEPLYPLDLAFCPRCALVQITETIPPEVLFRHYLYFSSFSETMLRHVEQLADRLCVSRRLGPESLVVEVASNDGYLLQYYRRRGVPVLGIEPAANVARVAEERGIPTLPEFFGEGLARTLSERGQRADVIHAHNVLAHVGDLDGFVRGLRHLLTDGGLAVIEVPYVKDVIDHCEFDTVYHEHLSYFSLTVLHRLFARHGLAIEDVERVPIHGGSLRLFVTPGGGRHVAGDGRATVDALLAEEAAWGVERADFYRGFGRRVEELRGAVRRALLALKQNGERVAAYGAAAKGTILLNYFGIGRDILEFVVDLNPHKQGRYVPGVHLPVYPPAKLLDAMPGYLLVLAWNVAAEIVEQQAAYRKRGGRFIIPVPEVRIM